MEGAQLFLSAILASTIGLKATSAEFSLLGDALTNVLRIAFPPASQASAGRTFGVSFRVTSTMEASGGKVMLDAYPSFRLSTPN